jgi:EmrB/QacA subfamily drug resistance transporter
MAVPVLRTGTAAGRWAIAASVVGSAVAFIDGTVVNAALPAIAGELDASLSDLQWVVSGYLLSLSALIVIGGALGDRHGRRRMFMIGLAGFAAASMLCAVAPSVLLLVLARIVQGAAAALLLPASLALISSNFAPADRAGAIGAWSGLGGIAGALGPFLGGYLIGAVSWRAVFFINVPVCAVAIVLAARHVPETRDEEATGHIDWFGGATLAAGLAGVVYALIEGPARHWPPVTLAAAAVGAVLLVAFVVVEHLRRHPMVPLTLFANRQFSGANVTTVFVYAALGSAMFLTVVHLQTDLGYTPLAAGAAFLPLTVLMLLFSARAGRLAQRIGPTLPMTLGPFVMAVGVALLGRVEPGTTYLTTVLPAVLVLGSGLTLTVAPLTAAVLGAIPDEHAGIGSAVNNAVARLGSLFAVAVLPAAAGLTDMSGALDLDDGFGRAMVLSAILPVLGGVAAALTVRRAEPLVPVVHGPISHACLPACVAGVGEPPAAAA